MAATLKLKPRNQIKQLCVFLLSCFKALLSLHHLPLTLHFVNTDSVSFNIVYLCCNLGQNSFEKDFDLERPQRSNILIKKSSVSPTHRKSVVRMSTSSS